MPTLLVFDPDPQVLALISAILRRAGYRVFEARAENEALRLWKQHGESIDLLVADPTPPKIQALLALAQSAKVLTLAEGIQAADPAVLRKPFTPDQLLGSVRKLLQSTGQP